jgi:shikimate kinase
MLPERVVLIGFMGAGKTTLGKIVAERLGFDFVDTDDLVEERACAPISAIFRDRGEKAFRDIESEVLAELGGRRRLVVATGGGAPAEPRNRRFFTPRAATFHLRVSLEAARQRSMGNALRPLLAQDDAAVRRLYESRQPIYEQLGMPVDTDGRAPAEVAEEIIGLLGNPRKNPAPGGNG